LAEPAAAQAERDYRAAKQEDGSYKIAAAYVNHNSDPISVVFSLLPDAIRESMAEFGISSADTDRMASECAGCTQAQYDAKVEDYYRSREVAWKDEPDGRRLYVDIAATVARNRPRMKELALQFDQLATQRNYGPDETVAAMIAFVQSALLYKRPPEEEGGRDIFGFYPPPRTLEVGFGDCDSKSALLAALLTNFSGTRMIGVHVPKHYLVGIARVPRPGDAFIEYQGEPFVLIEPAGPARLPVGSIGPQTQAALAAMNEIRIDPLF
jgi:hypothetical protein